QNEIRFVLRIENRADVVCPVAFVAHQQQHLAGEGMSVDVRRIAIDRLVEKRQHVLVQQRGDVARCGDFLFQLQQLFGGRSELLARGDGGGGEQERGGEHQRIVASRGRSSPSRTNSRTRRAMPSGCRSYWARRTSCAPWCTYSSGMPMRWNSTPSMPS